MILLLLVGLRSVSCICLLSFDPDDAYIWPTKGNKTDIDGQGGGEMQTRVIASSESSLRASG